MEDNKKMVEQDIDSYFDNDVNKNDISMGMDSESPIKKRKLLQPPISSFAENGTKKVKSSLDDKGAVKSEIDKLSQSKRIGFRDFIIHRDNDGSLMEFRGGDNNDFHCNSCDFKSLIAVELGSHLAQHNKPLTIGNPSVVSGKNNSNISDEGMQIGLKLPFGWGKVTVERKTGNYIGKFDRYYVTDKGKVDRSSATTALVKTLLEEQENVKHLTNGKEKCVENSPIQGNLSKHSDCEQFMDVSTSVLEKSAIDNSDIGSEAKSLQIDDCSGKELSNINNEHVATDLNDNTHDIEKVNFEGQALVSKVDRLDKNHIVSKVDPEQDKIKLNSKRERKKSLKAKESWVSEIRQSCINDETITFNEDLTKGLPIDSETNIVDLPTQCDKCLSLSLPTGWKRVKFKPRSGDSAGFYFLTDTGEKLRSQKGVDKYLVDSELDLKVIFEDSCFNIPNGWEIVKFNKKSSSSACFYYLTDMGDKLRSQKEVDKYIVKNKLDLKVIFEDSEEFDNDGSAEEVTTENKSNSNKRGRPKGAKNKDSNKKERNKDKCDTEAIDNNFAVVEEIEEEVIMTQDELDYIEEIKIFLSETSLGLEPSPPTKGDGNCWYRAAAEQVILHNIPNKPRGHKSMRLAVCDHVKHLPKQVREDTTNVVYSGRPKGIFDLASRQRKPGQWVDNTGVMVLTTAHFLSRNINLYGYGPPGGAREYALTTIEGGEEADNYPPLTIFYYDKHYQTLQPVQITDDQETEDKEGEDKEKEKEDKEMDDQEMDDKKIDDKEKDDKEMEYKEMEDKEMDDKKMDNKEMDGKEMADNKFNDKEKDDNQIDDKQMDDKQMDGMQKGDMGIDDKKMDDKEMDYEQIDVKKVNNKEIDDKEMDDNEMDNKKMDDKKTDDKEMDIKEMDNKEMGYKEIDVTEMEVKENEWYIKQEDKDKEEMENGDKEREAIGKDNMAKVAKENNEKVENDNKENEDIGRMDKEVVGKKKENNENKY